MPSIAARKCGKASAPSGSNSPKITSPGSRGCSVPPPRTNRHPAIFRCAPNFSRPPPSATAFGYRHITVERPLQLRIEPQHPEKRVALIADKAWEKLDPDEQGLLGEALDTLKQSYLSRTTFLKDLKAILKTTTLTLSPSSTKLLLKHLGEHDDDAEICKDAKGNTEANSDLRDNENVPFGEDIRDYFAREVTPHVPLAWIDESKRDDKDGEIGIIGYEIPFNRHFYTYSPPRPLDAIDAELAEITGEIQALLVEVSGA